MDSPSATEQICPRVESFHRTWGHSDGGPHFRVEGEAVSAQHPVGQVQSGQLWEKGEERVQLTTLKSKQQDYMFIISELCAVLVGYC